MSDLSTEIQAIQHALIHDPDYREAWVANVACAVMDENIGATHEQRQKIGERFVTWLCAGHPDDKMSQLMESMGL